MTKKRLQQKKYFDIHKCAKTKNIAVGDKVLIRQNKTTHCCSQFCNITVEIRRSFFDFHIVNFPFLSSNIPSGPSYGVYISQLIRYARCCSHYDDFRYRHKCLVDRLLSQGYKALRLEKSFKKFYGRYQDLIEKYRRSVNAMVSDSFPGQFLFNM